MRRVPNILAALALVLTSAAALAQSVAGPPTDLGALRQGGGGDVSDKTVTSSAAGAVPRTLASSMQLTARMLGAVADGVTDDTIALQRANTAMSAGYTVRIEPATYRTTATVVFDAVRGNLEAQGAIIKPDASVLVPVQLGSATSILSSRITGLVVDRVTYDGTTENEGFRLVNVAGPSLTDLEARYAKYNFRFAPGDGQRVSYLTLINPKAIYGYRNFWVNPVQAGTGFVTSVNVLGGRLAGSVSSTAGAANSNTIENLRIDSKAGAVDLIRFYGTEMEGNQALGAYIDAYSCLILNARFEGAFTTAAVQFGPNSYNNRLSDNFAGTTVLDGGVNNRIELATQTRLPGFLGVGISRAPTAPIDVENSVNGLSRYSFVNPNTGASRRVDFKIGTNTGGSEAIFWGVDQGAAAYKAYLDNRSGGSIAFQNSGTVTHTFGMDGSYRGTGGFGIFGVTAVTARPTLPAALATDGTATNAAIATQVNSIRSALIGYGLAQ